MPRHDLDRVPFLESLAHEPGLQRSQRTAVFLTSHPETVPAALLHNLKHYQVLHERNVLLTVRFLDVPWVPDAQRVTVEPLPGQFWRVRVDCGFKDEPDIPAALARCAGQGLAIDPFQVSYFLSREVVVPGGGAGMAAWRARLFVAVARNAGSAPDYFRLPPNCVIELGSRVQL